MIKLKLYADDVILRTRGKFAMIVIVGFKSITLVSFSALLFGNLLTRIDYHPSQLSLSPIR